MSFDERDERDPIWLSLSAMADGQADATERARCLESWSARADVRERWHAYQLIGDAMRSDDLARDPAGDAAFLRALRTRLADDRVVPLRPRVERSSGRWLGAAAVAAGVGAVALTLTMINPVGGPGTQGGATLAAASAPTAAVRVPAETPLLAVNGQLIRDARLDRYLAAHRQGATGASLQMPGAVVRSVDTIVLEQR